MWNSWLSFSQAQILNLKTSQENHIRINKDSGPEQTNARLEVSVLSDNSEAFSLRASNVFSVKCSLFSYGHLAGHH